MISAVNPEGVLLEISRVTQIETIGSKITTYAKKLLIIFQVPNSNDVKLRVTTNVKIKPVKIPTIPVAKDTRPE